MLPGITEKIINLAGQTPPSRLLRYARPTLAPLRAVRRGPDARRLKLFHVYPKRRLSQEQPISDASRARSF